MVKKNFIGNSLEHMKMDMWRWHTTSKIESFIPISMKQLPTVNQILWIAFIFPLP